MLDRVDDWTVSDLFAAVVENDQHAWDLLVERLSPAVWGVVRRFGLNSADTDELFQVVWLRLWDHRDQIREPKRLAGWVQTTARNEALAMAKAADRVIPTDLSEALNEAVDLRPQAEAIVEQAAIVELLRAGFQELTARCRRLLRLSITRPKISQADIAWLMDMPQGSVGPTMGRCLGRLRTIPEVQEIIKAAL